VYAVRRLCLPRGLEGIVARAGADGRKVNRVTQGVDEDSEWCYTVYDRIVVILGAKERRTER